MKFHVDQSDGISEYPSDWNCHPDTNLTDIVGEEIGEGNACSQGYHGQDNGHAGFVDCQEGFFCSFEDTIFFTGTVVLCNKSRVSITEILHRKIGKGVNLDGSRSRHLRSTYNVMPIPETYCAMTVANATPRMPHGSTAINKRSNPMFRMAETARNTRGIVEFPSARKRQKK